MFLENIEFDGKICRTERINDVLRCILHIDRTGVYLIKKRTILKKY